MDGAEGAQPPTGRENAIQAPARNFRMNAKAFMLTYNGVRTASTYDKYVEWLREFFVPKFLVWRYTHALEMAPSTGSLHIHVFLEWAKAIDWHNTDNVVFDNIRPDVRPNWESMQKRSACGRLRASLDGGHFYVWIQKHGHLKQGGNYIPFVNYSPRPEKTIDMWWAQHKISDEVYEQVASQIGVGFDRRRRDLEAKRGYLKSRADDEYQPLHDAIPERDLPAALVAWTMQLGRIVWIARSRSSSPKNEDCFDVIDGSCSSKKSSKPDEFHFQICTSVFFRTDNTILHLSIRANPRANPPLFTN